MIFGAIKSDILFYWLTPNLQGYGGYPSIERFKIVEQWYGIERFAYIIFWYTLVTDVWNIYVFLSHDDDK